MISITAEKLRDFQLCSYLFNKKHIEEVEQSLNRSARDLMIIDFEESLNKAIKFFYFEAMSNEIPSLKNLLWKWEKIWFKGFSSDDIVKASDNPGKNINSYNTDAHVILNGFWQKHHKNPGKVIALDEPYEVPLTSETKAVGKIDIVVKRDGSTILPHYTVRSATAFSKGSERYYKSILDTVAFRYRSKSIESFNEFYVLKSNKSTKNYIEDISINQVKMLSDEISNCKRYYPSSNYWCNDCQFSNNCWEWE